MGPALELRGGTEIVMETSDSKDHINVMQDPEDKNITCASNYECKFDMGTRSGEQNREASKSEDVEVDIINHTTDGESALVQAQSQDATESSSSFGDTLSEVGNHEYGSDGEVVSELRGDATPLLRLDGSGDLFPMRKKKLTSHWRTFIQPLMWRCKWVELQIKKFQSQAIKYDAILEKSKQRKQFKLGNFGLGDLCAKSIPFSHDSQREKAMKRKKRKRDEESDAAAYMSQHNLFSHFATHKPMTGGATVDDDQTNFVPSPDKDVNGEFGVSNELLSLDFRDDYSLEQILWKIEVAQSQVCQIKTRLNTVMIENAGRLSSADELSLHVPEPDNALTSSVRGSVSPTNRDGISVGASFASQLMELNAGDLVKPESAASSHEEMTHLPDTVESTDQPPLGATRKSGTDGILIYNRRAKKPPADSGGAKIHPIENLQVTKEDNSGDATPVLVSEDLIKEEPAAAPKIRSLAKLSTPSNKRKRAARPRRKASSSQWSRRSTG